MADGQQPLAGPKQRGLLALLVLRAGQVVATDQLVEELWLGRPPQGAHITLRSHLSRLRRTLERAAGHQVLVTRTPGYLLDARPEEIDAARFEQLVREGQAAAAARPDVTARALRAAEDLWRGPFLADLADLAGLDVVRTERARLEELRLTAMEGRIDADLALGRHAELVGEVEALLAENPLREKLHGQRMLALYRCGRQGEALAAFHRTREMLADELGIAPSATLQQLQQAVLRQEPGLDSGVVGPPAAAPTRAPAEPFVGRVAEFRQLHTALAEARAAHGRVVLLAGEPGIGKTRTVQEVAAEASSMGWEVLWGRAWEEEGAPAFWPWVQALRTWIERLEPSALRAVSGPEAPLLAQLVPAVADQLPELPTPALLKPAQARFQLFDAVTRVLHRASAVRPLLLILDDLHRADVPSLRLLQFLTRQLADTHLLVVGTYRDMDDGSDPAFRNVLAELWREPATQHLHLSGLLPAEVARYLELIGSPVAEPLVAELLTRTGGNPFFLRELVRLLLDEGGLERITKLEDRVPRGIQAAVRRRLSGLPEQTRTTLGLAAVVGRVFSLEILETAGDILAEPLLCQLEQAGAAGLVTELPGAPGRYAFSHVLIRDALYTTLSGARRARLHLRVGEAIERLHGPALDQHLAELAHHFQQAGRPGTRSKAASYAARAGEQALAVYAYEEAVRHFQRALDQGDDPEHHGDLLLRLAKAQIRAGDMASGRQTCLQAATLAREHRRPRQLARAAVLFHDDLEVPAFEPQLKKLLEEALEGLGDGEPALSAKVLARLAMTISSQRASTPAELRALEQRCQLLAEQAVALARGVDDAAVLAYALGARNYVHSGPEHTEDRLKVADEMLQLAESYGDRAWELQARRWRVITCAELGRFEEYDAEVEAYARTVEELHMPDYLLAWVPLWKALRTAVAGDLDTAERLCAQALTTIPDPPLSLFQAHSAVIWTLRREQGRLAELEPILADFVKRLPEHCGWRAAFALALASMGRTQEARRQVERLARAHFTDMPRDRGWLITMTQLAEICVLINDTGRAAQLYDLLLPFQRDCAIAYGLSATGPVGLHLGLLAEILGRTATARRHYEVAAQISQRLGARRWLARARRHLSHPRFTTKP